VRPHARATNCPDELFRGVLDNGNGFVGMETCQNPHGWSGESQVLLDEVHYPTLLSLVGISLARGVESVQDRRIRGTCILGKSNACNASCTSNPHPYPCLQRLYSIAIPGTRAI
jgi:hypothetical protein